MDQQASNPFTPSACGTCFDCGREGPVHQHHVVPRSCGGTATVPLCISCHGLVHSADLLNLENLKHEGLKKWRAAGSKRRKKAVKLVAIPPRELARRRLAAVPIKEIYEKHKVFAPVEFLAKKYKVPESAMRKLISKYDRAHRDEYPSGLDKLTNLLASATEEEMQAAAGWLGQLTNAGSAANKHAFLEARASNGDRIAGELKDYTGRRMFEVGLK